MRSVRCIPLPAASQQLPAEPGTEGDVTVRCWRPADAGALNAVVAENREHLRPWMPWADADPPTLEQRLALFHDWEHARRKGDEAIYGIFVDGEVAGGGGLHRRLGPDGLEIGYWLAESFTGRGVMTVAAGLMTAAAFTVPGIELVEIHHDKANERSAGVPRRLGFTLLDEVAREPEAPAESGVGWHWRITRAQWRAAARAETDGGSEAGGVQHEVEAREVGG